MKKKKVILIIFIIIVILGIIIYKFLTPKNFTIPQDYNLKLTSNMSYVDEADTTYYIYDNKIIAESIIYYPVGHKYSKTHTITMYNNIKTENIKNVDDVCNLLVKENGKKVYEENI